MIFTMAYPNFKKSLKMAFGPLGIKFSKPNITQSTTKVHKVHRVSKNKASYPAIRTSKIIHSQSMFILNLFNKILSTSAQIHPPLYHSELTTKTSTHPRAQTHFEL
jgi:hypothetical protein